MHRVGVRELFATGVLAALAVCASPACAQYKQKPSVEEILEASLRASGGAEAMRRIASRYARGSVEFTSLGLRGEVEIFAKAPNKVLVVTNLPGMGRMEEGFDGTVAWSRNSSQGLRRKSGAELDRARLAAEFHRTLKLRELYPRMELLPEETVNGKAAYVIRAWPASGEPETWYFDPSTYHLLKLHTEVAGPQGRLPLDTYSDDYREVDGLKIPFRSRQVAGPVSMTITLTEVRHNLPLDDSRFSAPAQ